MTVRCDCYLAGHASYVHIDARPPDEPWWAEWVDLYDWLVSNLNDFHSAIERAADYLRKLMKAIHEAVTSIAEMLASVIQPRHKLSVPPPIFVPPRIPDRLPRSSTLGPVKPAARSPP